MSSAAKATLNDVREKHPLLYHYTNEAGLRGIVESNSLRATYFGDLNDSKEIHELRVPLVEELAKSFTPLIEQFRKRGIRESKIVSQQGGNALASKDLARRWVNTLYRTTFEQSEAERQGLCCITSFCSHANDQSYEQQHGLLSQWRGYGGTGGFCLVFDTPKLRAMLTKERASFFLLYADLQPAFYFTEDARMSDLFSELFSFSKEIVESTMMRRDIDAGKIFNPFVTAATTTKHRGFFEEREIRMIVMSATKLADERIKDLPGYKSEPLKEPVTFERNGRSRLCISMFGKAFDKLPLTRVIVGPSLEQDRNAAIASEIVGPEIVVTKSATPFIG